MRIANFYISITALFLSLKSHSEVKVVSLTASAIILNGYVFDSDFENVYVGSASPRLYLHINTDNDNYSKLVEYTRCKPGKSPATELNEVLSSGLLLPYSVNKSGNDWCLSVTCLADSLGYTWALKKIKNNTYRFKLLCQCIIGKFRRHRQK